MMGALPNMLPDLGGFGKTSSGFDMGQFQQWLQGFRGQVQPQSFEQQGIIDTPPTQVGPNRQMMPPLGRPQQLGGTSSGFTFSQRLPRRRGGLGQL